MPETVITLPSYCTTLHDLAAHMRDGSAVDFGREIDDLLDADERLLDAKERLRDHEERLRGILEGFGALEVGDIITDPLDLLEVLLPDLKA